MNDDEPDARELWRWAAAALRPWAGWIFIGIGALLVLLGYLGVSREPIVEKQLPYLVSGGIGGVLLCVVGAYFLGTEELRKDSGRLDRVERMVEQLHAALLDRDDAPSLDASQNGRASATPSAFLAVQGGETYHRGGCPMAEGRNVETLTSSEVASRGLRPCPLCEPVATAV